MSSLEEKSANSKADFAESRESIIAAAAIYNKPMPDSRYFKRAWNKGQLAKEQGFARVSPYYEDELREPYWLAGYDGIEFRPPMIVKQVDDPAVQQTLKEVRPIIPGPEPVTEVPSV